VSAPRSAHLALFGVQLCFASWAISGKLALAHLGVRGILAVRVAGAALGFAVVAVVAGRLARARGEPAWRWPDGGREWLMLAVYAGLGIVANQLLYLAGLRTTTATNATVLGTTIPVFTVAIAIVVGRERATARRLLGIAVALAGVLVLARIDRFDLADEHVRGNLLLVANSLSYSLFLVFVRDVRGRYAPMQLVALLFGISALVLVPLGVPTLVADGPGLPARAWWTLAFIVAVPTLLAYGLNQYALRHAEASLVAIYVYTQPIMVALLAALILDERPGWRTLVAAGLVFVGVGIATMSRR
jgi:drug/metabolite transporter (DMT)-like permease